MRFKVKIEQLEENNDATPSATTIYEQVVEELDIKQVVKAVNGIEDKGYR